MDDQTREAPGWPVLLADVLARPGGSGLLAALDRPVSDAVIERLSSEWATSRQRTDDVGAPRHLDAV